MFKIISLISLMLASCSSPLMDAIGQKNPEKVESIINARQKIPNKCEVYYYMDRRANNRISTTPLMLAIRVNSLPVFNLLITKGVDIFETCDSGITALELAGALEREEMVKILLSKGARPTARFIDESRRFIQQYTNPTDYSLYEKPSIITFGDTPPPNYPH